MNFILCHDYMQVDSLLGALVHPVKYECSNEVYDLLIVIQIEISESRK